MSRVRTCLWFDQNGEEAAEYYTSLIPNSQISSIMKPDPNGPALIINLELDGIPYMILNAKQMHPLNEGVSVMVSTDTQADTDRLWDALLQNGGREMQCAWLQDRYGLCWQIVPKQLMECISSPDRAGADRAMAAMFTMAKIDIAKIEAAFRGE